jgi:1-acyl-sn-glycerol-3-phosphate acyltransferase
MSRWQNLWAAAIRLATGVGPLPAEALPPRMPAAFFANHSSHLDFAVIWAALPPAWRRRCRPVAGRDYWLRYPWRRWLAGRVFRAVLIERENVTVANNPLAQMVAALDTGDSLIVFPEGTRSPDGALQAFRPGLYHLARSRPAVPLVPLHLDNLNRILPKGELLPVPFIARLAFGAPLHLAADEDKIAFLARACDAIVALQRP